MAKKLTKIVKDEVAWYASGGGQNHKMFAVLDDVNQIYTVNSIGDPGHEYATGIVVQARVIDDIVIIDQDKTDKPLFKHLIQTGIPREKIILAYAGESIPIVEAAK